MAFDGSEGKQISINEASQLTASYRINNPNATLGHFIGRDLLLQILAQEGCMGIRIYYGNETPGNGVLPDKKLVLVGADSSENDMDSGIIADRLLACPNNCSTLNPLNS